VGIRKVGNDPQTARPSLQILTPKRFAHFAHYGLKLVHSSSCLNDLSASRCAVAPEQ
jgi:hypothetical protein